MKITPIAIALLLCVPTLFSKDAELILDLNELTLDQTYRHASELAAAINRKDWSLIPKDKGGFINIIKRYSDSESWKGVGCYRGTAFKTEETDSFDLKHKFGYESNLGPHELWVIYRKEENTYTFDQFMVLGW